MPATKIPKSSGELSVSRYDSRNDLGYGRTSDKFHKPRSLGSVYPYVEKSRFDDEEFEDEDTSNAIAKKIHTHQKSDPFSKKGTNPFYFAAGSTKLADCFFRFEKVISEVFTLSNSLSPVPSLSKKRSKTSPGSGQHAGAISSKSFRRTGSEKGYSSAPPEIKYAKNVNDEDEVIFNLEDLVKKLERQTGNFRSLG